MLKGQHFPRIDIPQLEIKAKLNSKDVATNESKELLEKTIAYLIRELDSDPFNLEVSIIENGKFSISISKMPSYDLPSYRISIDVGVFRWIYDALYIVLSNNDIFADYGRAYGTFNISTLEMPDWNTLDLAMANSDEDVLFDLLRMDLHNYLYNVCLSFIIRHEIRHIANGHIGYLLNQNQPLFFEHSANGLPFLDSQTLEMDVDSCVFVGLIEGFMKDPRHLEMMPEEFRNNTGKLITCLFCIQFIFYCLPSKKVSEIKDARENSHPNAFMRFFYCYTAGLSLLKEKYPELVSEYETLFQDNFKVLFANLDGMGLVNLEKIIKDYEWTLSDEGMNHADAVWNNWSNWVPKLEKYAFLKLAPIR